MVKHTLNTHKDGMGNQMNTPQNWHAQILKDTKGI